MRMNAHCKMSRVGSIEHVKCIQQLAVSWILYTEFLSYHLSNERADIVTTWNEKLFECRDRKRKNEQQIVCHIINLLYVLILLNLN